MTVTDDGTTNGAPDPLFDTGTTSVTVTNVAPANVNLTLSATTINENQSTNLSGTFTDPGHRSTPTPVVINWGDGSPTTTINLAAGVLAFGPTGHTYLDDDPTARVSDTKTISVTVTDDDGGSGTGSTTVTVNNVAPSALRLGPAGRRSTRTAATTLSGSVHRPRAPSTPTPSPSTGATDRQHTVVNLAAGVLSFSGQPPVPRRHPERNDPGQLHRSPSPSPTTTPARRSAQPPSPVDNVAPSDVSRRHAGTSTRTPSSRLNGTFADPGTLDTHTVVINWGDSSPNTDAQPRPPVC